ncbi:MAG: ABC transporter permease [Candidatus Falkowbacteria bacterium]
MFHALRQTFLISFHALLANKVRSFLTMLGIIIGVGAVVLIMSLGAGAQALILDQIKGLGGNLVGILPGKSDTNGPPATVMGIVITTLTADDGKAIASQVPNVTGVVSYSRSLETVTFSDTSYETNINGVSSDYLSVEGGGVALGRFLTNDEDSGVAHVAVLGSVAKNELFGDSDAVGRQIKIKKQIFDVIGVMEPRGKVAFQDYDDQIFIPVKTAQKLINGVNYLSYIRLKVNNEKNVDQVVADSSALLRLRHNISNTSGADDDFSARSLAQALDVLSTITNALRYFLTAMAAISLVVGGIGIMNIMLVSVNERTREIGLRKAVGATNGHITFQFIMEAVVITLIGGLIGICFGVSLSWIISRVVQSLGYNYSFIVTWSSVVSAVTVSIIIGLVFGVYPARHASRLDPVEALSYE